MIIPDLEPRLFVSARTGNLSQATDVNHEVAKHFMCISDLRRDIIIIDSNKKPEGSAIAVSSDTLAWRSVAPIHELTKIIHPSQRYHQVETVGTQYHVLIHDQIIDDDIRKKGYQDRADYDRRYVARLRREVQSAATEILFREKLGLREQFRNWFIYLPLTSFLLSDLMEHRYQGVILQLAGTFGVFHPAMNMGRDQIFKLLQLRQALFRSDNPQTVPSYLNSRSGHQIFYPLVPIDKWIKGRLFLAQHGKDLIINRE